MRPETSRPRIAEAGATLRVSAIVAVGETTTALEECVEAALLEPWVDELILVDAGVSPALASSLRALQADRRDVRFVQSGAPLSHSQARNVGAAQARGRWLLFLDSDVVLQRGAAERLIRAGRLARAPWVVGGGLTDAGGRRLGANARSPMRRRPAPVETVDGGFLLAAREEFFNLGGFDEDYTLYGETHDLCRRARRAGGAVWLQPTAEARQYGRGRVRNPAMDAARRAMGLARLAHKHARGPAGRVLVTLWGPLLVAAMTVRAMIEAPFRRLGR